MHNRRMNGKTGPEHPVRDSNHGVSWDGFHVMIFNYRKGMFSCFCCFLPVLLNPVLYVNDVRLLNLQSFGALGLCSIRWAFHLAMVFLLIRQQCQFDGMCFLITAFALSVY